MKWQPIEPAPRDGRWIIVLCNDRATIYRVSWGVGRDGRAGWCSADRFFGGGGVFAPFGGWVDFPDFPADARERAEHGE